MNRRTYRYKINPQGTVFGITDFKVLSLQKNNYEKYRRTF